MGTIFYTLLILSLPSFSLGFKLYGLEHLIPRRVIEQDTERVEFLLYPKAETLKYREELILDDPIAIKTSLYNKSRPLILLVHGFVSESKTKGGFTEIVKNAYLTEGIESNIVAVDWSHLSTPRTIASEALYDLAALNVKPVGRKVADFILFLLKNSLLGDLDQVHIVGYSLGAQVAGKAGRYIFLDTGKLLGRITALDPAGPSFNLKVGTKGIVDKEDAAFVDIVHTNAGQLGSYAAVGHIDFYPNGGGPLQPNCSYISLASGGCSHSAAYRYYAKSIRDPTIIACKCNKMLKNKGCMDPCDNPVIFGEFCPNTANGIYYLPITYDAIDT